MNGLGSQRRRLLEVTGLTARYRRATEPSLYDISLTLDAGELVLVAGPSGSGKSTLLRVLNGLVPRSYRAEVSGRVLIAGTDSSSLTLRDISDTVGTLLQDPGKQVVGQTVLTELAFGLENRGVDPQQIRSRCEKIADRLGLTELLDRTPRELSGGQLQLTAFAGILVLEPELVVIDEPLANLDPDAAGLLLTALRGYVDAGGAAIVVEHRVDEVLGLRPDRVLYLEQGRLVYSGDMTGFLDVADPRNVKLPFDALVSRPSQEAVRITEPPTDHSPAPGVRLRYTDADLGYPDRPVLCDVDLVLPPAQQVAVVGRNGSGKSTLLKAAVGIIAPDAGEVTWEGGKPAHLLRAAELVAICGYVFQNPAQALFCPTIGEELAFGPRNLGLPPDEVDRRVASALTAVGLDTIPGIAERPPRTLSFGQQRRLAVAVALSLGPRTLVLDEPTAGQDLRSSHQFLDAIVGLAGIDSQYLITHDLELALSRSDRVLVIAAGGVAADASPAEIVRNERLWHHEDDLDRDRPLRENGYIRAARSAGPSTGRLPDPLTFAARLADGDQRRAPEVSLPTTNPAPRGAAGTRK